MFCNRSLTPEVAKQSIAAAFFLKLLISTIIEDISYECINCRLPRETLGTEDFSSC
jgi:hypothetical protein